MIGEEDKVAPTIEVVGLDEVTITNDEDGHEILSVGLGFYNPDQVMDAIQSLLEAYQEAKGVAKQDLLADIVLQWGG